MRKQINKKTEEISRRKLAMINEENKCSLGSSRGEGFSARSFLCRINARAVARDVALFPAVILMKKQSVLAQRKKNNTSSV